MISCRLKHTNDIPGPKWKNDGGNIAAMVQFLTTEEYIQYVRHERTVYKVCVTAQEMRVGPSEPACRSRFQTPLSCAGKEPG
ncbi:MAG: hypothetical protein V2A69_10625 [Pseudomonadota bacterium]